MKKSWEGKGRWGIERGECKKAKWQSSCVEMKTMIFVLLFVSSISAKILETIAIELQDNKTRYISGKLMVIGLKIQSCDKSTTGVT